LLGDARYNCDMKTDITILKNLEAYAGTFLASIAPGDIATVVTLSGDLGAGKTTFTQLLGKELGITNGITSPTYVIEQRYPVEHDYFKELVHIDAYRLDNDDDPIKIGLDQTLADPTKLVVIEWPERISTFLEQYKKHELFFTLNGEERFIERK